MEDLLRLLQIILNALELEQTPQSFLVLFLLSFIRYFSFVTMAPFFGGRFAPLQVKIAVSSALVLITYPSLTFELPADTKLFNFGAFGFLFLLAKEFFVGYTLGFVSSLIFEAVKTTGRIIDTERGLIQNESLYFIKATEPSQMGEFKYQLAIVVFLAIDAHRFFLTSLIFSFTNIPILRFPEFPSGFSNQVESIVSLSANMLSSGTQLALPFIITLLLTDLFFGFVNRYVPQINTLFLYLPIKMWTGIFVLSITVVILAERIKQLIDSNYQSFETFIQTLSQLFTL